MSVGYLAIKKPGLSCPSTGFGSKNDHSVLKMFSKKPLLNSQTRWSVRTEVQELDFEVSLAYLSRIGAGQVLVVFVQLGDN